MAYEPTQFPGELQGDSLQILSDNIPGGVFSCRLNPELTLLQMNGGFLQMLGYTRQDIRDLFHDSFWNMIDPRDRLPTLKEVNRQMALGPDKELEYRMLCKDGSIIWVLDKGHLVKDGDGNEYFCCMLVDITRSKALESSLRLSLERHQIIMNQTSDILFDWDILADTITVSSNWEKRFGFSLPRQEIGVFLRKAAYIHPEDQAPFLHMLGRIRHGKKYAEIELRILTATGSSSWYRIRATGLMDESDRTVRVVGVIIDIDSEKRQAQSLMEQAQHDTLTKLLNKGACQEQVEAALAATEKEGSAALMIIDLDNFKQINDSMGHLFGDALLTEVARTLQRQFRSQDIVGRVGGDEFLVFLPHIPTASLAQQKASQVLSALHHMEGRELTCVDFSCSIGIAVFPECGTTYHELFRNADQALYQAKKLGKNRFSLFDYKQPVSSFPIQRASAVSTHIDSDETHGSGGSMLVEYTFRTLYKSTDTTAAINAILEVVGLQFDVSRVYIFEDEENGEYSSNTFEWCNEGVAPQREQLQHMSYTVDMGGDYKTRFNENGIFYCRDIADLNRVQYEALASQNIKSMLQCAIYDNGRHCGFVGFDECRGNRYWTQEQVDALAFISEILGTFLLKQHAQERAKRESRAMESLLNQQDSWIFILRPETHEILYLNERAKKILPEAEIGLSCFNILFHRNSPCGSCPILGEKAGEEAHWIYLPGLKSWALTEAHRIIWKGENAVLVCCQEESGLLEKLRRLEKSRNP